jgi:hypothetical protein
MQKGIILKMFRNWESNIAKSILELRELL